MDTRMIVSSRGQVVIPKAIRKTLGLHSGSELIVHLRKDKVLELQPIQRKIQDFFGMGAARLKGKRMSISDIDAAISKAIEESNK